MRKLAIFLLVAFVTVELTAAQIAIKKASAVKEQEQTAAESATGGNLVGTALGLFQGMQMLKTSQAALTRECAPKQAEVDFVNKMVQEYAKTGNESAADMLKGLPPDDKNTDVNCRYEDTVAEGEGVRVCYDRFTGEGSVNTIWEGYPKAAFAEKCPANDPDCKQKSYYSNIYEVYARMNWKDADLMPEELSAHSSLIDKAERCDPEVLKRKKREMTTSLITSTIGGVGQKQNAGAVMGQVGALMQNGGGGVGGAVGQLGTSLLPGLMGGN